MESNKLEGYGIYLQNQHPLQTKHTAMTAFNLTIKVQSYDFSRIVEIACPDWATPEDMVQVFLKSDALALPTEDPIGRTIRYVVANERDEILESTATLQTQRNARLVVAPEEFYRGYVDSIRA